MTREILCEHCASSQCNEYLQTEAKWQIHSMNRCDMRHFKTRSPRLKESTASTLSGNDRKLISDGTPLATSMNGIPSLKRWRKLLVGKRIDELHLQLTWSRVCLQRKYCHSCSKGYWNNTCWTRTEAMKPSAEAKWNLCFRGWISSVEKKTFAACEAKYDRGSKRSASTGLAQKHLYGPAVC